MPTTCPRCGAGIGEHPLDEQPQAGECPYYAERYYGWVPRRARWVVAVVSRVVYRVAYIDGYLHGMFQALRETWAAGRRRR